MIKFKNHIASHLRSRYLHLLSGSNFAWKVFRVCGCRWIIFWSIFHDLSRKHRAAINKSNKSDRGNRIVKIFLMVPLWSLTCVKRASSGFNYLYFFSFYFFFVRGFNSFHSTIKTFFFLVKVFIALDVLCYFFTVKKFLIYYFYFIYVSAGEWVVLMWYSELIKVPRLLLSRRVVRFFTRTINFTS